MKTQNNTILITGGGSGIGLETARKFSALGNKVIIAGRNIERPGFTDHFYNLNKESSEKAFNELNGVK